MRNRMLRNPENYAPAKDVALALREIADDLESKPDYINFSLQLWFATRLEVEKSLRKKLGTVELPD